MTVFYATYSASNSSSATVTALQGTTPWVVAGNGTAGTSATGVLSVQGIAGGTAVPISGSITATNPSIGTTGSAVPASGTYIAASVAGTLTGLVATASGLKVDGSAVTQPVSGSVTVSGTVAATQSGTWNVTNVSGTVSLPTGASTEATLAKLAVAQGSTTSGQSGTLTLGAVTTAAPSYTTAQTSPLSLTTGGALRVDASGSTQPVSGTVAATQSGTWTVQPGNTQNTTPWLATISAGGNAAAVSASNALKVDASATTQPVSGTVSAAQSGTWNITNVSGTVSLPTGASTEATLVKLPLAQGSTTSGESGVLIQGAVTTSAPSYTTAQTSPLSLKTDGSLRVDATGTVTANAGTGTFTTDQVATTSATFQDGAIAFGTLSSSYQTVITTGGALKNVSMRNNTNAVVIVSLNAGSTTSYTLDSGDAISLDLKTLGLNIPTSTALQAKHNGVAATSGSIRINGVY